MRSGWRWWRDSIGRSFGQNFAHKAWRHRRRKNRAIPRLLNFQAVKEGLYIGIGTLRPDTDLCGMKKIEKSPGLLRNSARVRIAVGKCLGPQMKGANKPA